MVVGKFFLTIHRETTMSESLTNNQIADVELDWLE